MRPEMGPFLADMLPIVTFTPGTAVLYFHRILPIPVVNGRYWQVQIKPGRACSPMCMLSAISPTLLFSKLWCPAGCELMPYSVLKSITPLILQIQIQHSIQGAICYLTIVFSNNSIIAFSRRAGKVLVTVLLVVPSQRSGVKPLRIWLPSHFLGNIVSPPTNVNNLSEKPDLASFSTSGTRWTGWWLFPPVKRFLCLVSKIWVCFMLQLSDHMYHQLQVNRKHPKGKSSCVHVVSSTT